MSSTTTARLGLIKPTPGSGEPVNVQTQINDSWDKIDAAIGATICTSSTRPATPYAGQIIYETDTGKAYVRTASASWLQIATTSASFSFPTLTVGGVSVYASEAGTKGFTSTGTCNSTTYINLVGAPTISFTKVSASSKIRIDMKLTCFSDTGSTGAQLGVSINGTDYDVAKHYFTGGNEYETFNGFAYVTGVPAGTYTITPRWKRFSGSGILNTFNTISELDISARETP